MTGANGADGVSGASTAPIDDDQPSGGDPPSGDDLRAVMADFATGVVVATTWAPGASDGSADGGVGGGEGVDHATTLNSLTSVSLDPPLVLISLGIDSRFAAQVRRTGVWGVSILPEDHVATAMRFAARDRGVPLFGDLGFHRGVTGVALLDDALGRLECRTEAIHRAGDHDIVVGRVAATEPHHREARPGAGPLVSFRRAFGGFHR